VRKNDGNSMKMIVALIKKGKQIGSFAPTWSAENVSSDAYFCRLRAIDFFSTKKMILMK